MPRLAPPNSNKLIRLPQALSNCTKLKDLNVGCNKIKTLPNTDAWVEMEKLKCHQNGIIMLPSFANMVCLRFLKMDRNRGLGELPELGEKLAVLEHLEANSCYLGSLPKSINTLKSLATLNCQNNQLQSLPFELVLPKLSLLNCSSNPKLKALPVTLGQCESLRICFFGDTAIAAFPEGFGALSKLERVLVPKNLGLEDDPEFSQASATASDNNGWVRAG